MYQLSVRTKGNANPTGLPRVYFTCHPKDFGRYFDKVCEDIFKSTSCAVYYLEDMTMEIPEDYVETDLGRMNLFVMPVTFRLLTQPNRAMEKDFRFAMDHHIPVLPFMMETGIDSFYSRKDRFGELQYLSPYDQDPTSLPYEEKLKNYLQSVLVDDETAKRIRAAFDAYIFLSYRKKDRKYANELMRMIHANPVCRDIAIWYDEYLTPGESFNTMIQQMLVKSDLFALLVTPNLVNEENYIRKVEYPTALEAGKKILPVEMEETDPIELKEQYQKIPGSVTKGPKLDERLMEIFHDIAIQENDNDPTHNYLIGLDKA